MTMSFMKKTTLLFLSIIVVLLVAPALSQNEDEVRGDADTSHVQDIAFHSDELVGYELKTKKAKAGHIYDGDLYIKTYVGKLKFGGTRTLRSQSWHPL